MNLNIPLVEIQEMTERKRGSIDEKKQKIRLLVESGKTGIELWQHSRSNEDEETGP